MRTLRHVPFVCPQCHTSEVIEELHYEPETSYLDDVVIPLECPECGSRLYAARMKTAADQPMVFMISAAPKRPHDSAKLPVTLEFAREILARTGDVEIPELETLGSGPYSEDSFDSFLVERGITPCKPVGELEMLVIGHSAPTADLDEILRNRQGKKLRVYSQELFLLYLITGFDPLDGDHEWLMMKASGHPGLDYLSSLAFPWPTTDVWEVLLGTLNLTFDRPALGLLGAMGYRVGKNGVPEGRRRVILTTACLLPLARLPEKFLGQWDDDYLEEWGSENSAARLSKMADSIATFCRNQKRKRTPSGQAIADWESDLRWLKATFYVGRYRFRWPSTKVF